MTMNAFDRNGLVNCPVYVCKKSTNNLILLLGYIGQWKMLFEHKE